MAQTTLPISLSEDMYLSDIISGAHGDKYQKNLAQVIFERATIKGYDFKLGYEMAIADKFDDVAFFNKNKNEWILIQTKHADTSKGEAQPLEADMLFPLNDGKREKGDFSLFKYLKSYATVRANIKERKNIIIFTNRDLLENSFVSAVKIEPREVDEILRFENASHVGFKLEHRLVEVMLEFVNRDFHKLRNSIIKLFKEGIVDQTILNYKTPVSRFLIKTDTHVKFSETLSSETRQILTSLEGVIDIKTAQLPFDKCKQIFTEVPRKKTLPTFVDEETAIHFFQDLILSFRQPNDFHNTIDQDLRLWMRTCVRPDCLQRLEEPQLVISAVSLDKIFDQKNSQFEKLNDGRSCKKFILLSDGEEYFGSLRKDMETHMRFMPICSHGYMAEYYVGRHMEYEEPINDVLSYDYKTIEGSYSAFSTQGSEKNTVKKTICDNKFVELLSKFFEKHRILVITAEPGMGKSTILEFIALNVQQRKNYCVYHFNLSNFNKDLLKIQETVSIDELVTVFATALSKTNFNNLRETIKNKANKIKHLLVFDGFDELYPKNRDKFLKIFSSLWKVPNLKMLVSTRRTVKFMIENEFDVKTLTLKPFSDLDQMNFLRRFWKVAEKNEQVFCKYVADLFKFFHSDINRALVQFTGIPLMLKMLAEVFTDHFTEYLDRKENILEELMPYEEFSIINLYEQFVKKCFTNKMMKKLINLSEENDEEFGILFKTFTLEHQLLAMKHLHIELLPIIFKKKKYTEAFDEFETRILNGAEKSPLIEVVDRDIRFIHLSYAEFLVAKFLFDNIKKYEMGIFGEDSQAHIFDDFSIIRIFFFSMIEMRNSPQYQQIIEKHYNVNESIALLACEAHSIRTVELLLLKKSDLEIVKRLLGVAALYNCYSICEKLLDNHQDIVGCTFKGMNLTELVQNKFLVDEMHVNSNGWTALHLAALNGNLAVVEILIRHSGDVNAKTDTGLTPFAFAAEQGHLEVMKLLSGHSVDVNVKLIDDWTPLHFAAYNDQPEVLKALIEQSGDVHAKSNTGLTPMHLAAGNANAEIVKILVEHCDNVNARENNNWTPLHFAAQNGHLEIVKTLITAFGDINAKAKSGSTPLYLAAGNGHLEVVKILIDHSGDVNAKTIDDWTPLHFVAQNGHLEVIKMLTEYCGDVSAKTKNGLTPICLAAINDHSNIVKTLIDHAEKINAREIDYWIPLYFAAQSGHSKVIETLLENCGYIYAKTKKYSSSLNTAAGQGHLKAVKTLIEHFGDVDVKCINDWTPLHSAAHSGHLEVVKILTDHTKDVNAKTNNDWTPLYVAAGSGHLEIVKVLIGHFADVDAKDSDDWTPLHIASLNGHTEVVETLIDHYRDINARTKSGTTPLYLAAGNGHSEVVKILIRHSGDVNVRQIEGWTPLHLAAGNGHSEVTKILVDNYADVNAKTDKNLTPLSFAAENGHIEVTKILCNDSADVNQKTIDDWTPLHFAVHYGHSEVIKILIKHSGNVNAKDINGWTPLHIAAFTDQSEVVNILIEHGGKVNAREIDDWTPLHLAALHGHQEVVNSLIKNIADVNAETYDGWTPLMLAARNGRSEVVQVLIDRPDTLISNDLLDERAPLYLAVKNGYLEVVKVLTDYFANANETVFDCWALLPVAAEKGHANIIKFFVEKYGDE